VMMAPWRASLKSPNPFADGRSFSSIDERIPNKASAVVKFLRMVPAAGVTETHPADSTEASSIDEDAKSKPIHARCWAGGKPRGRRGG
jgi:hypothetical protein